jgi:hypothetical protein
VDVVREVIKFIKGRGKALQKQWWPYLAKWARWDGEAGSRGHVLCFKAF